MIESEGGGVVVVSLPKHILDLSSALRLIPWGLVNHRCRLVDVAPSGAVRRACATGS